LKKYNDKRAAASLYQRCSELFRNHARVYEAFFAGMAAYTVEDHAEAVKQFKLACSLNPYEPRCQQNLRLAEEKLAAKQIREQKK
jgi:hypothetical protein